MSFSRELHHEASRAAALGYKAVSSSFPVKTSVCCFEYRYCISRSDGSVGSCSLPSKHIDHQFALHRLEAHYFVHCRRTRLCQLEDPALSLSEADCSVNMLDFSPARVSEVGDRLKHVLLRGGRTRGVSRRFNVETVELKPFHKATCFLPHPLAVGSVVRASNRSRSGMHRGVTSRLHYSISRLLSEAHRHSCSLVALDKERYTDHVADTWCKITCITPRVLSPTYTPDAMLDPCPASLHHFTESTLYTDGNAYKAGSVEDFLKGKEATIATGASS